MDSLREERGDLGQDGVGGCNQLPESHAGWCAPGLTWAPRVQGRLPRIAPRPRTRPACTSRSCPGLRGWSGLPQRTVRSTQGGCRASHGRLRCPARDPRVHGRRSRPSCSSRSLAACTSGTCPGLGAPRGPLGAPHGPPWCGATPARAEHVRTVTRGGALRGADTHPVTPRMLGARVVGVLGHPPGA